MARAYFSESDSTYWDGFNSACEEKKKAIDEYFDEYLKGKPTNNALVRMFKKDIHRIFDER